MAKKTKPAKNIDDTVQREQDKADGVKSPIEILFFQGLVQQQMRDDDLIYTLEALVGAVKDHPDAKCKFVGNVNVGDLDVCMFSTLDYWVVYRKTSDVRLRVSDFRKAVRACIIEQQNS